MATSQEYAAFVCEQVRGAGTVRARKMFGEYMVYINEKPILLVCDNTVFVKKLDCIQKLMENAETGTPYDGAKEHYILDVENQTFAQNVIALLEAATPLPKPRKKKS